MILQVLLEKVNGSYQKSTFIDWQGAEGEGSLGGE